MISIVNINYLIIAASLSALFIILGIFTLKRIVFYKRRDIIRNLMFACAFFFLGLIISGTKLNWKYSAPVKEKMEIIFALDTSLSSLAQDAVIRDGDQIRKISRLDLEKKQVENVIDDLSGDAIGIIIFADQAITLQNVLSREDYKNSVIRNLQYIDKEFIRYGIKQGTDYGILILSAMDQFGEKKEKKSVKKILFVLTDGEAQGDEDKLRENLSKALETFSKRDDISTYFIGVGDSREPSKIPKIEDEDGKIKEWYRDKNGEFILTRPNPEFLANLANSTKGHYIHSTTTNDIKTILLDSIEKERRIVAFEQRPKVVDLTPYLLISSLFLLFAIPIIKSV